MTDCDVEPYWSSIAQRYNWIAPPLRPSAEHIGFLETTVAALVAQREETGFTTLLLGVTPDIIRMRWPDGLSLIAMDNSWPMVSCLWPGTVAGSKAVICGDWRSPALPRNSIDLAVGDGSLNCLSSLTEIRQVASNISSLLTPRGVLLVRSYVLPAAQELPEDVFAAMHRGEISSCHHLRLRLLMAVQEDPHRGVSLAAVHRCWSETAPDARIPDGGGWEKPALDLIEQYAGCPTKYCFPSLAALREVLHEFFAEDAYKRRSQNRPVNAA